MAFYSSKKILINSLLSLMSMIVVGLAFQNCSNGLSSSAPTSNTATSDTSGMRVISDPEDTQAQITTDLKIELLATDLLKVDCSLPGSGYKFEISNAGSDILMCQEYTLDMPAGNSRYGESYKCDSSDKFVRPASAWSYDVGQRKWSKTTYTNSDQFTPGDYRLYVRDNLGEVRSSLLKMRHYGYANCVNPNPVIAEQPGIGGGSVNTGGAVSGGTATVVSSCSWSGDDFSPARPPQSACSQTRANAKENGASGVEYTCVCTQATVVVPPSSSGGAVTTPNPVPVASGTTCNPAGTKLVRIATQLPDKSFPRTDYHPAPNQIHVFEFKTPNTLVQVTHRLTGSTLGTTPPNINPVIILSECPGDVSNSSQNKLGVGCSMNSAESAAINIAVNITPEQIKASGASSNRYCYLKPNTQYYANVFSQDNTPFLPSVNCSNPHCGFSFQGN